MLARASASTSHSLVLQAHHQGTAVNPSPDVAPTLWRWEEIKPTARDGTANGRRSGMAMEGSASRPWKRGGCVVAS
jgi:gentisate 1,2-dioxygenase